MAVEDFTTFTEVDPSSDITVTSTRITFTTMLDAVSAYVAKSFGVNHFQDDFEHLLDVRITGSDVEDEGHTIWVYAWTMANVVGDYIEVGGDNGEDHLTVRFTIAAEVEDEEVTIVWDLQIQEMDQAEGLFTSTTLRLDSGESASFVTRYLEIERDETVGTWGTFYCRAFSDATRETLLGSKSLTLHTSKKDYRYVHALQSRGGNLGGRSVSGWTQNLDIQEAVAVAVVNIGGYKVTDELAYAG